MADSTVLGRIGKGQICFGEFAISRLRLCLRFVYGIIASPLLYPSQTGYEDRRFYLLVRRKYRPNSGLRKSYRRSCEQGITLFRYTWYNAIIGIENRAKFFLLGQF